MIPPHINILTRLNQIGTAINNLVADDFANAEVQATLRLIVESAVEVVPGSSSVIYTYDEAEGVFDHASRVAAEGVTEPAPKDFPRQNGFGSLAIKERRRVLSYEENQIPIHPDKTKVGARIMTCYPLIVKEGVLGVLYLYLHNDRHLNELELLALGNFVNQAAMALYVARQRIQAEEREARKGRELRRLRRAGVLISTRSNLQETLDAILQIALDVMDAQYGIFRLVDDAAEHLITRAFVGEGMKEPALEALPINDNSIMGQVARSRKPIIIDDLRQAPYVNVYYPLDHKFKMLSELAVPLIGASGKLEGVLNFESPQRNAFTTQDRYILQILASQAVIAIQEARLLDAMQEISTQMLAQDPQAVLDKIVEQACALLNVNVSMLWMIEENALVYRASTLTHLQERSLDHLSHLIGQAVLSGQPVSSYDMSQENDSLAYEEIAEMKWGSALIVPVMAQDGSTRIGAISIITTIPDLRNFDEAEWEKKVLNLLGHYASLAIQNADRLVELRLAEEKQAVAETFAAVGDIAANLLHRVNNKMGVIPVRVEGILDKCESEVSGSPYLKKNLMEIEQSAVETMEIVRDSLFHLRPMTLGPVSVRGSLNEAIRELGLEGGTGIHFKDVDALPMVQADKKRLALVFTNLLENATVAMGGVGDIHIQGAMDGPWVTISLQDNGPGIPPHIQDRIFEFTFSGYRRERPGKLGFGLWWVKTLMTRFGGTINVESDGTSGTNFILKFPVGEEEG